MTFETSRFTLGRCSYSDHGGTPKTPEIATTSASATLHHYVIVRSDLPRGLQAAQIVHAAGESVRERVHEGTHAVVLVVDGEASLEAVRKRLVLGCVPHVAIVEPDAPWSGQLMALGLEPARKEVVRRVLSSLPLLK